MEVCFKRLSEQALMPTYGSEHSAGADLYACLEKALVIEPRATYMVPIGLAVGIPEGYVGLIYARSGLASKKGLAPANKVGVIDADYRGEIFVPLYNHGRKAARIEPGERIAQLVVTPFLRAEYREAEELEDTARGSGGFGSTGRK